MITRVDFVCGQELAVTRECKLERKLSPTLQDLYDRHSVDLRSLIRSAYHDRIQSYKAIYSVSVIEINHMDLIANQIPAEMIQNKPTFQNVHHLPTAIIDYNTTQSMSIQSILIVT